MDDQAATSPAPSCPARRLSAEDVARALGCKKRIVLRWVEHGDPPPPHDMTLRRGRPSPSFDLDEIRAWAVAHGKRAVRRTGTETSRHQGVEDSGDGAAAVHAAGGVGPVDLWAAAAMPLSLDDRITRAAGVVDGLLAEVGKLLHQSKGAEGVAPLAASQLATAIKGAGGELRQLIRMRQSDEERSKRLVDRTRAAAILAQAAAMVRQNLSSLSATVPARLRAALADQGLDVERQEFFDRVASVCLRGAVDDLLARMSQSVEQAAGALERAETARKTSAA